MKVFLFALLMFVGAGGLFAHNSDSVRAVLTPNRFRAKVSETLQLEAEAAFERGMNVLRGTVEHAETLRDTEILLKLAAQIDFESCPDSTLHAAWQTLERINDGSDTARRMAGACYAVYQSDTRSCLCGAVYRYKLALCCARLGTETLPVGNRSLRWRESMIRRLLNEERNGVWPLSDEPHSAHGTVMALLILKLLVSF